MITATIFRSNENGGLVVGIDIPNDTNPEYVNSFMKSFFTLDFGLPCAHMLRTQKCLTSCRQKQMLGEGKMK